MSYHEIETEHHYKITCRGHIATSCPFTGFARTATLAEEMAAEHIDMESREGGMPNYDHAVEISEVTLVGRHL